MKRVAVIYKNSDNQEVINYLKEKLENIFENYILIENYYLEELSSDAKIEADAYIINDEDMMYSLKGRISSYSNIVNMYRSLSNKYLNEVVKISDNTDVLVVNDTYESSVQALCGLYELGISHINLIPFDPKDPDNIQYRNFKIAVTPNEEHLVPNHIEKIINIGYREISFNTIMRLMIRLNLDFELTNRNLVRHIRSLAEPNIYIYNNYLNNFVKNHVFSSIINDSPAALIITNEKYHVIFSNDKARKLFNIKDSSSLDDIFSKELFLKIKEDAVLKIK